MITPKLNRDAARLRLKMLQDQNPVSGLSHDAMQALLAETAAPGEDLAWLAAHDLDPEVSSGAFSVLYYALRCERVSTRLRDRVRKNAAPVLLKALQSCGMPDSRKYSIGPLYSFCIGQVSGDEYRAFFKDFDGITNRMIKDAIKNLGEEPRSVDNVLTRMEALLETDLEQGSRFAAAIELAEHMFSEKPAAAAALAGAAVLTGWLEEDVRDGRADDALRLLEQTRHPRAFWMLNEIAGWPGLDTLHDKVSRAAQKMRLQGVKPACPQFAVFSHGLVTAPDGLGLRQMALFYDAPGGVDALLLLFSETVGLKDVICVFGEGKDVEQELRERARDLATAPCRLPLARDFLADAMARHHETGLPPPANLIIYRSYLGAAPIEPRRRSPDLSNYRLAALRESPELVANSGLLAVAPSYSMFMFTSDTAYEFFRKAAGKKRRRFPQDMLERFLREVAVEERETLLARLAATLEVEDWAGRARKRINQTAARTWLGISQNVLPFHQVPYVKLIGKMSAEMIIENVRMGFSTQEEVNEAALLAEQQS